MQAGMSMAKCYLSAATISQLPHYHRVEKKRKLTRVGYPRHRKAEDGYGYVEK